MSSVKVRLIVAAAVFLAWIGFLAYLVIRTRDAVIVSPPQFYSAKIHVVAHLTGGPERPEPEVTVKQVLWAAENVEPPIPEQKLTVQFLDHVEAAQGWAGEGDYLLPLAKDKNGSRLVPIPTSPTYSPPITSRLRIYPARPDTLAQWREIHEQMTQ